MIFQFLCFNFDEIDSKIYQKFLLRTNFRLGNRNNKILSHAQRETLVCKNKKMRMRTHISEWILPKEQQKHSYLYLEWLIKKSFCSLSNKDLNYQNFWSKATTHKRLFLRGAHSGGLSSICELHLWTFVDHIWRHLMVF